LPRKIRIAPRSFFKRYRDALQQRERYEQEQEKRSQAAAGVSIEKEIVEEAKSPETKASHAQRQAFQLMI